MIVALSNTFIAYFCPSCRFSTKYTSPNAPLPRIDSFLKEDSPIYFISSMGTWLIFSSLPSTFLLLSTFM